MRQWWIRDSTAREEDTPELKRHILRYLDRCMHVNLTKRNEKGRGDERDTATVYDILFLHLVPFFSRLGLIDPAWLVPMILRYFAKVHGA